MKKRILYTALMGLGLLLSNLSYADGDMAINPVPGGGFNPDLGTYTNSCVKLSGITHWGTSYGSLDVMKNYSYQEFQSQLKQMFGGVLIYGYVGFIFGSIFEHDITETDNSITFIYRSNFSYNPEQAAVNPGPNGQVLNFIGQKYAKNRAMFDYYCGKKFVTQVTPGASLYVAVTLNFYNHDDKQKFINIYGTSFLGIVDVIHVVEDVYDKLHLSGNINIKAIQEGGDPAELGKILGKPVNGVTPMATCSFKNTKSCDALIQELNDYGTSNTGNNFLAQFKNNDPANPYGTAVLSVDNTEDYDDLTINLPPEPNDPVTSQINQARSVLKTAIAQNTKDMNQNQFWLNAPDSVGNQSYLDAQMYALQLNRQKLADASLTCYRDLPDCVSTEEQTISNLHPVDRGVVEQNQMTMMSSGYGASVQALPNDHSTQLLFHVPLSGLPAAWTQGVRLVDIKNYTITDSSGKILYSGYSLANDSQLGSMISNITTGHADVYADVIIPIDASGPLTISGQPIVQAATPDNAWIDIGQMTLTAKGNNAIQIQFTPTGRTDLVDSYQVMVDGKLKGFILPGQNTFTAAGLQPGSHTVTVQAISSLKAVSAPQTQAISIG